MLYTQVINVTGNIAYGCTPQNKLSITIYVKGYAVTILQPVWQYFQTFQYTSL